jgi:photosystem II stability/assembly factor-like uncharacterized protein
VITGLQDNGTIITRNGMMQWNGVFGGDGAYTAINPESPSTYYVSSQSGNIYRLNASNAQGTRVWVDTLVERRRGFIAPFVLDASRPTRLYFGGARLFRTENQGTAWTPISPDLTRGTGVINAIALAPSDSNVIFVGTSDGNVRYSRDFGVTWLTPQSNLPARTITDFAVHPTDANKVVVTIGGSGGPHVYISRDGGVTWNDITAALPDVTTQAVAWGPAGRLYVGNMYGVYESGNEGQSWTRQAGMPTIRVTDLVYNARTNRLVAATYGRGIWAYDFSTPGQVLRGDVNGDGEVNAADALLIQQALIGVQLPASVTLFPAADANCDGRMEILDALLVLRSAVGEATGQRAWGRGGRGKLSGGNSGTTEARGAEARGAEARGAEARGAEARGAGRQLAPVPRPAFRASAVGASAVALSSPTRNGKPRSLCPSNGAPSLRSVTRTSDSHMRFHVAPFTLVALALGTVACAGERSFTSPEAVASFAKAPSVADPSATFFLPSAATGGIAGVFGDDYRLVGGSSTYADGDCGVTSKIFATTAASGSGDATMHTSNPKARPKTCAAYPRKITIRYTNEHGVQISDTRSVFMNLRAIAKVGSALAINDTTKTILAITLDGTGTGCSQLRWNPNFQSTLNGSSLVTVTRVNETTYRAWTTAGERAYCEDNGLTYDIPVNLTVVASKPI